MLKTAALILVSCASSVSAADLYGALVVQPGYKVSVDRQGVTNMTCAYAQIERCLEALTGGNRDVRILVTNAPGTRSSDRIVVFNLMQEHGYLKIVIVTQ